MWRYLQAATPKDILSLPIPKHRDLLSSFRFLSDEERWLIAYHVNPGSDQNTDAVTKFSRWNAGRSYISENLHKIKHWEVLNGEYRDIPNIAATWFVDPPYQRSGKFYRVNTVDYAELGDWCLSRKGPVCVCEQSGATWLPFAPLKEISICGKKVSREEVYLRGFEEGRSGDQPVQEKPVTVQETTPTPETAAPLTLDDLFGF